MELDSGSLAAVLGGKRPPSSSAVYHHLSVPIKDMASFEMPQELVLVLSLRTHSSAPIVPISMVERRSCKVHYFVLIKCRIKYYYEN